MIRFGPVALGALTLLLLALWTPWDRTGASSGRGGWVSAGMGSRAGMLSDASSPSSAGMPWDQVRDSSRLVFLREEMVRGQIEARGIADTAVLRAMRAVPRHQFVPGSDPEAAYGDHPLPIGHGQTISQPYIVAFMAAAAELDSSDRVLEIGTGSGYGAAVLGELAREVFTVEIVPELAERASRTLAETGYTNVRVRTGNGWMGWPEHAPYDAVVVTAAPDEVPETLVNQLTEGGTLVVPVGDLYQTLRVLRKTSEGLQEIDTLPVRFVPMVGEPPDTGSGPQWLSKRQTSFISTVKSAETTNFQSHYSGTGPAGVLKRVNTYCATPILERRCDNGYYTLFPEREPLLFSLDRSESGGQSPLSAVR